MPSLKEKLGKRIQEIRKSRKLTQEKLAEMIGLDIPNLSNIERGKRFVKAETLEKIVQALNVTERELFDFEHIKTKEELIKDINKILKNSNTKDVEYFYRMLNLYREKNSVRFSDL